MPCRAGRVAVGQLQSLGDQVAQQRIGHPLGLLARPHRQPQRLGGLVAGPAGPVLGEAGLAEAGLGHHADQLHRGAGPVQHRPGLPQRGQRVVAADQRRADAGHAAAQHGTAQRPPPLHQPGGQRLVVALDLQRGLGAQVEQALHQAGGVVADAQRAGRRMLLHPRGQVDGGAADGVGRIHAAAQQHRPGVQAHPHIEAGVAVVAPHLVGQQAGLGQDGQTGGNRIFGIVLARQLGAEGGQQAVAGVLQGAAVEALHQRGEAGQGRVHHLMQVLGVELPAQRGGPDHVHEHHRHLAQLLLGQRRGALGCQPLAQGVERHVEHRVVDLAAQPLQRDQARFEGGGGRRHGGPGDGRNRRRAGWRSAWPAQHRGHTAFRRRAGVIPLPGAGPGTGSHRGCWGCR